MVQRSFYQSFYQIFGGNEVCLGVANMEICFFCCIDNVTIINNTVEDNRVNNGPKLMDLIPDVKVNLSISKGTNEVNNSNNNNMNNNLNNISTMNTKEPEQIEGKPNVSNNETNTKS